MLLLITEQKRNWKCICLKNVDFPQNTLTLSLCGFGNFILTVGLAKDKKEQKRDMGVERAHRFCKVLLDVFIHFYVRIISSHE